MLISVDTPGKENTGTINYEILFSRAVENAAFGTTDCFTKQEWLYDNNLQPWTEVKNEVVSHFKNE